MIRCDDCGKPAADAMGSRQCSLLDADDDPRIDVVARVDLRAGRVLCPACARGVPLPFDPKPKPRRMHPCGCGHHSHLRSEEECPACRFARKDGTLALCRAMHPEGPREAATREAYRAAMAEAHVTAAESADAEAELDDEQRAEAEATGRMMDGDTIWQQTSARGGR